MGGGDGLDARLSELVVGAPTTELQRAVLEHDWGCSALGAEADWSPTLRTAVSTVLNSRFPMLLMWGPELVMVYNDGYAQMLGDRHPAALGRRARDVWADVWPVIAPMLERVVDGAATFSEDLFLVMSRNGFDEETYFTFSYSPVVEPGGRIAGVLDTAVETTARVLGARRLALLQQLGSLPRSVYGSAAEACTSALGVLAGARADCPFGLAYLLSGDGVDLAAGFGVGADQAAADEVLHDWVQKAVSTGSAVVVGELAERLPGLTSPGAGPVASADVHTAVALPLVVAGRSRPVGALVLGVSPHLHLDEEYRAFLALVAGQVAAAVTDAQAVEIERRRAAEQAEQEAERARFMTEVAVTFQRAVLGPTALPEGFAVHYEPAAGTLEVGGDWYDVVALPGLGYGVVVGDVVGRGLPAAVVMGQLRSAGRALLLESHSPAQVLTALDGFAEHVPGAVCSTVFCAVIDPQRGTFRYSSAGHPPAVLVSSRGRARLLDDATAMPLAVVDAPRPEAELPLPPAATLMLYTDGLVERRHEALDEGMTRLAGVLVEGRRLEPSRLAELVTDRLLADAPDDDVAFLLYRSPGRPTSAVERLQIRV